MLMEASLADKYELTGGRVFLTGIQALVRLPIVQRRRDRAAGLKTAGYISGYRGSPLSTYDLQLGRAAEWLTAHEVHVQPGLNEDLALTSVWGSQQAEARGEGKYDGVFALWYGKGAGTDRSGDAFRHGNNAGSSKHGGVLILLGDDHRAESSSAVHASEFAMADFMIPVLNPADVRELLEYGLYGIAMSRFTGSWVSLKCNHEVVESAASIDVDDDRALPVLPVDVEMPPDGLNLRAPDAPLAQEIRVHDFRIPAVKAFCRANGLDRTIWKSADARLGIVTTGKAYLDVLQALDDLGIGAAEAAGHGVALYKVAMPWPLEPEGIKAFCAGLDTIVCVEEKRGLIEPQLKDILFGERAGRAVLGKLDEGGRPLFPPTGTLSSNRIGIEIGKRLQASRGDPAMAARISELEEREQAKTLPPVPFDRKPYFCSGCPHNRSTVIPESSLGGAGTGCNYMVMWMDRRSDRYTQMGADGANWIGEAPFSNRTHMFQNMGDGTYSHSGLLAIRATVAAKVNITFKILFNDVVAMTGGQVHDAPLSVPAIARQVLAQGVSRVVVVADDPSRHRAGRDLPAGVAVRHRDDLDAVQRELREVPGVTVLIYDQMCAAEKRRRRTRGILEDLPKRAFINHLVCDGCGDCGVKSNCVSILPMETDFGRKRRIDQHSCNKDFSCVDGFCPSFVTVHGGRLRAPARAARPNGPALPDPPPRALDRPYGIVVSGVGGTGIVTISAILGMAAHLEEKGCSTLDMMGLAQKGGAVTSHVRIARDPAAARASRIAQGAADLVLGCDMLSVASAEPLSTIRRERTQVIVNTHEAITGDFTRAPDLQFPAVALRRRIEAAAGSAAVQYLDATAMAEAAVGTPIATNVLMVGYAYQQGLIPLSRAAVRRALELNGVAVEDNLAAFEAGRRAWHDGLGAASGHEEEDDDDLDAVVTRNGKLLAAYQDRAYARHYATFVEHVRAAEGACVPGTQALSLVVARNLARLMAYKDEYEVARLYTSEAFRRDLESRFVGPYKVTYRLAPPLLAKRDPSTGERRKRAYGGWIVPLFHLLARVRRVRGTPIDVFGYTEERRTERRLISDYQAVMTEVLEGLHPGNHALAVSIASHPASIRGFGHVKTSAIDRAKAAEADLLEGFRRCAGAPPPGH